MAIAFILIGKDGATLTTRRRFARVSSQVCGHSDSVMGIASPVPAGRRAAERRSETVINLRDPKAREEFLASEKMMANQKLMEGGKGPWGKKKNLLNAHLMKIFICTSGSV